MSGSAARGCGTPPRRVEPAPPTPACPAARSYPTQGGGAHPFEEAEETRYKEETRYQEETRHQEETCHQEDGLDPLSDILRGNPG